MKLLSRLVLTPCAMAAIAFAEQKIGKPLSGPAAMPLAALMAAPAPFIGKTVQVRGKVTEVCDMAGCWMNLTDSKGNLLRIKADDGVMVFPRTSVGKEAIAEGTLEKHEMTRLQVIAEGRHGAEESGRKFNAAKVKSGKTVYQLAGSGALILD